MSELEPLAGILRQILQMTREEGAAIQSSDWDDLRRIQARKATLREVFAAAARTLPGAGAAQPKLAPLRARAARILSLLNRNSHLMAVKLRETRQRHHSLEQAARNLRRVQRAYLRPRASGALKSYS